MIFENDDEKALFEQFKEWRKDHGEKKAFDYYREGKNPYSKTHWNLTAQAEILSSNPHRALELAREAGDRPSIKALEDYIEQGGK